MTPVTNDIRQELGDFSSVVCFKAFLSISKNSAASYRILSLRRVTFKALPWLRLMVCR
jgi:hypothetical protein